LKCGLAILIVYLEEFFWERMPVGDRDITSVQPLEADENDFTWNAGRTHFFCPQETWLKTLGQSLEPSKSLPSVGAKRKEDGLSESARPHQASDRAEITAHLSRA
jgi:hypothetical protein